MTLPTLLQKVRQSDYVESALNSTILGQSSLHTYQHSPLAALTSCLNKLGGDMMCPVVRAEKAAEAEGSPPSTLM